MSSWGLTVGFVTEVRRATFGTGRWQPPRVGNQAPKISFATVIADIARGQPA